MVVSCLTDTEIDNPLSLPVDIIKWGSNKWRTSHLLLEYFSRIWGLKPINTFKQMTLVIKLYIIFKNKANERIWYSWNGLSPVIFLLVSITPFLLPWAGAQGNLSVNEFVTWMNWMCLQETTVDVAATAPLLWLFFSVSPCIGLQNEREVIEQGWLQKTLVMDTSSYQI